MKTDDGFEVMVTEDELFNDALLLKVRKIVKYGETQVVSREMLEYNPEILAQIAKEMMQRIDDRINCK